MEKGRVLINSLIARIEKENPQLKKLGGVNDSNLFLNQCSKDEVVEFIKSARFSINPFVGNTVFKKVKTEFTSMYIDINFEYSVLNGLRYRIDPFIVETLDINIFEYVMYAVEKLLPDKKGLIRSQWESWTIEQRTDLVYELERSSLRMAHEWLKENAASSFWQFADETRENILRIMKTEGFL